MAVDREELVILLLSAGQEQARSLSSALETQSQLSVRALSDPDELVEVLQSISDDLSAGREVHIGGLVADLTAPGGTPSGSASLGARADEDAPANQPSFAEEGKSISWSVAMALAAMSALSQLPLVIISYDERLAQVFRLVGPPFVEVVPPTIDDAGWRAVAGCMIALSRQMRQCQRTAEHSEITILPLPIQPPADSQVWIDLERCQVSSAKGTVPLTGQEVRVLEVLMRTPGRFHSASELAEQVGSLVDRHCIQQTMSGLRKKLGERARAPQVLLSRRGLGYAFILPRPVRVQRAV